MFGFIYKSRYSRIYSKQKDQRVVPPFYSSFKLLDTFLCSHNSFSESLFSLCSFGALLLRWDKHSTVVWSRFNNPKKLQKLYKELSTSKSSLDMKNLMPVTFFHEWNEHRKALYKILTTLIISRTRNKRLELRFAKLYYLSFHFSLFFIWKSSSQIKESRDEIHQAFLVYFFLMKRPL